LIARSNPPALDASLLRRELQRTYAKIALFPRRRYHLNTGRALAELVGYDPIELASLPAPAVDAYCGAGNPVAIAEPRPGEAVLDVGCGAGLDLQLAARRVGPTGRAVGIDSTPEMVQTARLAAKAARARNVRVEVGQAERLPFADASFDVVLSNNVVNNRCVDKLAVLREVHRVLRPGGRLAVADVMIRRPIPDGGRAEIGLWTC
jgi:SAM-dependent methyltransferase